MGKVVMKVMVMPKAVEVAMMEIAIPVVPPPVASTELVPLVEVGEVGSPRVDEVAVVDDRLPSPIAKRPPRNRRIQRTRPGKVACADARAGPT